MIPPGSRSAIYHTLFMTLLLVPYGGGCACLVYHQAYQLFIRRRSPEMSSYCRFRKKNFRKALSKNWEYSTTLEFEYCPSLVCALYLLHLADPEAYIFCAGPLPSIFGLHIATYVLCELAGKPISNPLPIKGRKKLYERLLRDLLRRESKLTGQIIK